VIGYFSVLLVLLSKSPLLLASPITGNRAV
jgi:hypothetical protein